MKNYPIIHVAFPMKSFSWADGLYAIIKEVDDELHMCRINDDGTPEMYDGKFSISCTGKNNKGITRTSLVLIA